MSFRKLSSLFLESVVCVHEILSIVRKKDVNNLHTLAVSVDVLQIQCVCFRHSVSESVAMGIINLRVLS